MLIQEGLLEGFPCDFCQLGVLTCFSSPFLGHEHLRIEEQGVIPQGVDFHHIARTRNNRNAIHFRVHPCHSMFAAIGEEKPVLMQLQVWMLAFLDETYNLVHQLAILLNGSISIHQTSILLDTPDGPQKNIRFLHLIHLNL